MPTPKEDAYYKLGDLIYNQNPYGGYDQAPGKPGEVRTTDLGVANAQLEARGQARRNGRPAQQVYNDDRVEFAVTVSPAEQYTVVAVGPGASFNADDPYEITPLDPTTLQKTGLRWSFDGQDRRVSKAMRVTYKSKDKNGGTVWHALLIGYEGGGGM